MDDETRGLMMLKRLHAASLVGSGRRNVGAEFGLELRGLLGMVLTRLSVIRIPGESVQPQCEVSAELMLPNRDNMDELIVVRFCDEFIAMPHHTDRKMTAEQSCILQALRFLWDHELGESVLVNGEAVWDPEGAHAR